MLNILAPDGILVTYCSKEVMSERALLAAGFSVEKITGPPGKREMIKSTQKRLNAQWLNA